MIRVAVSVCIALFAGRVFAETDPTLQDLLRRSEGFKPRPEHLRWQEIPWILDLNEALKLAREERRPLLLWASGGPPFEAC
jgi:hypothetical protein